MEYEQSVAEIVQGMHAGDDDFVHFCALPISTTPVKVVVEIGYSAERSESWQALDGSCLIRNLQGEVS